MITANVLAIIKVKPPLKPESSQHTNTLSKADQNNKASVSSQMGYEGERPTQHSTKIQPAKANTLLQTETFPATTLQRSFDEKDKQMGKLKPAVCSTDYRIKTSNKFDSLPAETAS